MQSVLRGTQRDSRGRNEPLTRSRSVCLVSKRLHACAPDTTQDRFANCTSQGSLVWIWGHRHDASCVSRL
jgi:hypothetical protein